MHYLPLHDFLDYSVLSHTVLYYTVVSCKCCVCVIRRFDKTLAWRTHTTNCAGCQAIRTPKGKQAQQQIFQGFPTWRIIISSLNSLDDYDVFFLLVLLANICIIHFIFWYP